jgi:serine protease Do
MGMSKKILGFCLSGLFFATSWHVVLANGNQEKVKFDFRAGFAHVAETALPSVVNVATTQVIENKFVGGGGLNGGMGSGGIVPRFAPGSPFEELFREFFDGGMDKPRKVQSLGSGFVIANDKKHLLIVTNNHVVSGAKSIKVFLNDKTELEASVLATDERTDIAVLKASVEALPDSKKNIPVLEWADSDDVKVGQWVIAIGNPFGFGSTVTTGIISCKGRYIPTGSQQDFEYIQHSAPINMGNSGGCLLSIDGKVVGINNAIITNSGGNIGIGFSIPAKIAKNTVEQLIKHGKIRRGYLGIRIQHFTDDMAESLGLQTNGAIVGSVSESGVAFGKIEAGDIIIEYDGKKINQPFDLSRMVAETEVGKLVKIKLLRKDKDNKINEITVDLKVEELNTSADSDVKSGDSNQKNEKSDDSLEVVGIKISNIPDHIRERLKEANKKTVQGVMVVGVDFNSYAYELGLSKGDIIEQANQKDILHPKDFQEVVEDAKQNKRKNILLLVTTNGEPRYLPLKLDFDKRSDDEQKNVNNKVDPKQKDESKDVSSSKKYDVKQESAKPEVNNQEVKKEEQQANDPELESVEKSTDSKAKPSVEETKKAEESIANDSVNNNEQQKNPSITYKAEAVENKATNNSGDESDGSKKKGSIMEKLKEMLVR